eukprot:gene6007-7483_t
MSLNLKKSTSSTIISEEEYTQQQSSSPNNTPNHQTPLSPEFQEIELQPLNSILTKSSGSNLNKSSSGLNKSSSGLGKSQTLSKSQTIHDLQKHEYEQENQIPLYYSVAKAEERKRELKIRQRIKEKFKKRDSGLPKDSPRGAATTIDIVEPSQLTGDHTIPLESLAAKYETDINFNDPKHSFGLSSKQAEERLERDGRNSLTPTKPTPIWVKFLKQFVQGFPLLLEIGGILAFVAYGIDKEMGQDNLYLAIILWIVVLVTCTFSFIQDSKSASVMESFRKLAPASTKVLRDRQMVEINSEELVVGDVVVVRAGDKVPADIRIIYSHHFKVDNASLTGESEPQTRTTQCTDENPLETHNIAFYSTLAVGGDCVGVVIATGDNTTIGKIAKLASKTKPLATPLQKEIEFFCKIVSILAIGLGVIFVVIGFSRKVYWVNILIFVIGVIVSQVPEALLPTITVALNFTAKRMARKNVYVKNLLAVEAFGSTRTIASDKTGTLTQNIMTVVHLWYDNHIYSCGPANRFDPESVTFKQLYQVAALCNRTVFDRSNEEPDTPIQQRKTIGDASESALLKFCEQVKEVDPYRIQYPKIFEIPFNSTNKWQLSVHIDEEDGGNLFLVMKGAPERIVKICSKIIINGEAVPFTEEYHTNFQQSYEFLAGKGERALGMAFIKLDPSIYHKDYQFDSEEKNFPTDDLTFVGLTTLMDPPRPGVPDAIQTCKEAGIRVIMVTGDHPLTATSIAKQVGIIEVEETLNDLAKAEGVDILDMDFTRGKAVVIPGNRIDDLSQEHWDKILSLRQIVFARTSPEQKLQIVEQCQLRGDIVAVTGDGVNDSPALKKSDLGCAMGITGSEVAREAASIILLDDNFSSIVAGIEEGRMIFDKLKKAACYTLSSNIPEIVPFFCFFVLQMPVALSGILILSIDLGTDLIPVLSFAYETQESDIMKRQPRNVKKDKLLAPTLAIFSYFWLGSVQCAAGLLNYFLTFQDYNLSASEIFNTAGTYFMDKDAPDFHGYNAKKQAEILREAQTAYFIAIVLTRVGAALSCKTRKISVFERLFNNTVFNIGIIFMVSLAVVIVHVPGLQDFFGCSVVNYKYWLLPLPFAFLLIAVNEIRLLIIRRYPEIQLNQLPQSINELILKGYISFNNNQEKIPSTVRDFTIQAHKKYPLKPDVIPSSVTYLTILDFSFESVLPNSLPSSVKILKLEGFSSPKEQKLISQMIPTSVTKLTFNTDHTGYINTILKTIEIPSSVKKLKLNGTLSSMILYPFPPSITSLTLSQYNHFIRDYNIPKSVTKLKILNSANSGKLIPLTVRRLKLGSNFDYQFEIEESIPNISLVKIRDLRIYSSISNIFGNFDE